MRDEVYPHRKAPFWKWFRLAQAVLMPSRASRVPSTPKSPLLILHKFLHILFCIRISSPFLFLRLGTSVLHGSSPWFPPFRCRRHGFRRPDVRTGIRGWQHSTLQILFSSSLYSSDRGNVNGTADSSDIFSCSQRNSPCPSRKMVRPPASEIGQEGNLLHMLYRSFGCLLFATEGLRAILFLIHGFDQPTCNP